MRRTAFEKLSLALSLCALSLSALCEPSLYPPGDEPPVDWPLASPAGTPQAIVDGNTLCLSNEVLSVRWDLADSHFRLVSFTDLAAHQALSFDGVTPFFFKTETVAKLDSSQFVVVGAPKSIELAGDPKGIRLADRIPDVAIQLTLRDPATGLMVDWQGELREGANYVRQLFTLRNPSNAPPLSITGISLVNLPVANRPENSLGTVPGSPYAIPGFDIVAGVEEPGYLPVASGENSTALEMPTQLTLLPGDQCEFATVIGVFPRQQRRRSFLYYLERERASPSRHYLHYNAWYDLGFNLSDKTLLPVVKGFGEELTRKRGITLDGFVLDDGWDNPRIRLWTPDPARFPKGWSVLKQSVREECHASLGIWISPCGGYTRRNERIASAIKLGALPRGAKVFDVGVPSYYALYRNICLELIRDGGMNYFKWDNAAPHENHGRTFGNLKSTSHFIRLCQLARELRKDDPNLFINATAGTWPSPFWLNHVDCTWRGGDYDVSWIGKGDRREQGMNYRDGEVYEMVVKRAPLYPLNGMMFCGVVLGHCFQGKETAKAGNMMTHEFRSYFALGVNLQELYLSPDLMNDKAWDDLADAIRWNRKNAATLVDAHWVQGNPKNGEPYAVAAWRRNAGTLMMRNPNDKPQTIRMDIATAFELPPTAARKYDLRSPYPDQRLQSLDCESGRPLSVTLEPFEVLVFDCTGRQ